MTILEGGALERVGGSIDVNFRKISGIGVEKRGLRFCYKKGCEVLELGNGALLHSKNLSHTKREKN